MCKETQPYSKFSAEWYGTISFSFLILTFLRQIVHTISFLSLMFLCMLVWSDSVKSCLFSFLCAKFSFVSISGNNIINLTTSPNRNSQFCSPRISEFPEAEGNTELLQETKLTSFSLCELRYNYNYNKILKSDWLSTTLISALIGQFNETVGIMPK